MDKQQLVEKTAETLRPFETANLMTTIQNLTLQQIFTHPVVLIVIAVTLFFGVYKKSTPVLLTLFFLIAMIVFVRYAIPAPGEELTLSSILPFIGAGVVIGGVIIYFSMIRN
jgi:hypothetical protein